jgi:hypothetical protein
MTTPAKTQTATDARVAGSELKVCMTKTRSENDSGITNIQEGGQSGRSTPRSGETLELLLWAMTLFLIICDILCWSVKNLLSDLTSGAHEAHASTSPVISVTMLIFAVWNIERMLKNPALPNAQLTAGGPPVTSELPSGSGGPPFGEAPSSAPDTTLSSFL